MLERKRGKKIWAVDAHSSSKAHLDSVEASSSSDAVLQGSDGDLKSVAGIDHEVTDTLKNTTRK